MLPACDFLTTFATFLPGRHLLTWQFGRQLAGPFLVVCFYQFFPVVVSQRLDVALRLFKPVAGNIQFDDDAVMNQAVDSRGCSHRIFEDSFPFRKGKIAGQQDTPSLITFRQQCENHLHFLACLPDVSQIVNDHSFIPGVLLNRKRPA